ncbi:hypothetical protein K4F52_010258, partial [Lecanicillium sp. MT-2017a]
MACEVLKVSELPQMPATNLLSLIYNIDEYPYPGAKLLRLLAAIIGSGDTIEVAKTLKALLGATAAESRMCPSSSDLKKILEALKPDLETGFEDLVLSWGQELKVPVQHQIRKAFIVKLLDSLRQADLQ